MQYQLNQQIELPVRDLRVDTNTGAQYAVVYDDEREYRIYNLLKCQAESLPEKMYLKVCSVSAFGCKLRQDEGRLFMEHYQNGKLYCFDVKDVKLDHNSDKPYYIIEDDFASHHYYFNDEQKYQIGDACILEVKGFTDKGFLKLVEPKRLKDQDVEKPIEVKDENAEKRINQLWNSLPVLDVEENETLELKTSIVFPPKKNGEADIDTQLYTILTEITAFMNTKGGVLLIGIHDKSKKVIGIEGDLVHLNDGEDEYAASYKRDNDGYELKIRNTIDRLCPSVANSLISIEFPDVGGHVYCKITVKPARRPIFLNGTQLWIRQGNRRKKLTGDEITFFITERMEISIKNIIDMDGLNTPVTSLSDEKLREVLRTIINERRSSIIAPPPPSLKEIDYWIVWNDDSTWIRQRQKADGDVLQVPVYKGMSDPVVVFCYDNNRINTVKLSVLRKKVNLNDPQKNGWCPGNGKPKNIFVAEPSCFVVIQSIDFNSIEYVKLHALTDFAPTATAKNGGAPILPDSNKVISYSIIGAEHRKQVSHLIGTKAGRSKETGIPTTSPALANEIEYLQQIGK
ncbi:MAG: ATP-binding protein [Bacteroidaceae bacterium]|nr:ATP-binding protein [Bacteroidaceae bacterium]